MKDSKNHWGLAVFIISCALTGTGAGFVSWFPPAQNRSLYALAIPLAGLILSVISFAIGHFSYPRIHDLRVYISGYLSGLIGVAFFGSKLLARSMHSVHVADSFIDVMYLIVFVNGLFIPFLPGSATYRTTKQITIPIFALEFVLLLTAWNAVPAFAWLEDLLDSNRMLWFSTWFPVLWSGAVLLITVKFTAEDFHLGGVLAGLSVIFASAWLCARLAPQAGNIELLLFTSAQLFLSVGLITHWFVRIEHRIQYDPLLKIYNRDYCMQILSEKSSLDSSPPFAIAMLDIDHFKKVNDTHGHQAGDMVLHSVAQAVKKSVMPDGVLCRYGGEELAVFFPGKTAVDVRSILEKTRITVEKTHIHTGKKNLSVTISAGISHRASRAQTLAEVVSAADRALYKAKEGGRNQIKVGKTTEKEKKK
jgi:diguanylate cyclase (GGDEF)-like protein